MFVSPTRSAFCDHVEAMWGTHRTSWALARGYLEHQAMVASFISPDTPYRGLLLFHALGSGKTAAASAAIEAWKAVRGDSSPVFVITPASLKSSFASELSRASQGTSPKARSVVEGGNEKVTRAHARTKPISHGTEQPSKAAAPPARRERGAPGVSATQRNVGDEKLDRGPSPPTGPDVETTTPDEGRGAEGVTFISQNGLTAKKLQELSRSAEGGKASVFDGALIVVDEAHNISRALAASEGGASSAKGPFRELYDMVRLSANSKVLLMTATPVHNRAVEISFLANMACGPLVEHTVAFTAPLTSEAAIADVTEYLDGDARVDSCVVTSGAATLRLVRDERFVMADKRLGTLVPAPPVAQAKRGIAAVVARLGSKVPCSDAVSREFEILPTDRVEFDALFVGDNGRMKNVDMLKRRLVGAVSAFAAGSRDVDYPRVRRNEVTTLSMGDHQLSEYVRARVYEQKLEAKQTLRDDDMSVFRFYSRVVSNFAFPPSRTGRRPFRFEQRQDHDTETKRASAEMRRNGFWKDDARLTRCSPKFHRVFRRISADGVGKVMVYSAYRTWEGIGLFSELLIARGWRQVSIENGSAKVRRASSSSAGPAFIVPDPSTSEGQTLIALFNGVDDRLIPVARSVLHALGVSGDDDGGAFREGAWNVRGAVVRAVLLSRSGAEGISLMDTRQVHILEPHWNAVQLEQVTGRAVRLMSHARLPEAERDVSVFTYVCSIPLHVKGSDEGLAVLDNDKRISTDEHIAQAAMRKARISAQIADVLGSVAVDCTKHAGPDDRSCYRPSDDWDGKNLVPAHIFEDPGDTLGEGRRLRVPIAMSDGTHVSREVVVFERSADVFDARVLDASGDLHPIGFVSRSGKIEWTSETS